LRIGIVANEASADLLGARLMRQILEHRPDSRFEGVAGPQMLEAGCLSLVPMERLSVMGLAEILRHLPALLGIRRRLARHFLACRPDVFVGIDAPGFNIGLARRLRRAGIPTVQYVSPTVWAWRSGRVKSLRRAEDLVLSIYPFEEAFLHQHQVPAVYVGHPLATEIPLRPDRAGARERLGLDPEEPVIALLPGSRVSEVTSLAADFVDAASVCAQRRPGLKFITPLVNSTIRALFQSIQQQRAPNLPIRLVDGNSRDVLAAADLVLTASGTATLEALLHKRPMVVAYRVSPVTHAILKRLDLIKVPFVAMANILAGEPLAPEFIQDDCQPAALGQALLTLLDSPERRRAIADRYQAIHQGLLAETTVGAGDAVLGLIGDS
jgi:lipid-A-disaccharide synthase